MELLQYFSGKYVVCAASNGTYEQQIHRLEVSGLAPYLTHSFISEQVGAEKPSWEFFDTCMKVLNLSDLRPEEVMMIGDSLTADMAGGISYGMQTCWYDRYGKGLPDGVEVDHVVRNLAESREFL